MIFSQFTNQASLCAAPLELLPPNMKTRLSSGHWARLFSDDVEGSR